MICQSQSSSARTIGFGLAVVGAVLAMTGCTSGGVRSDPSLTTSPSSAEFTIAIDATDPADKQVVVTPNEGDAWLVALASPGSDDNKVVWRSNVSFAIKFVQIDDQTKKPSKKFGDEGDGWNDAVADRNGYKYKLTLKNGAGTKKKSIQGAKYLVKSPAGCDDSTPGPDCVVLDPVFIVRY